MSLRFLADENFDGDLLRALLRRRPDLDVVRVQDVGLAGADDADVLAWAAQEGRVLLTHDVNTVVGEQKAVGHLEDRRGIVSGRCSTDSLRAPATSG